MYFPLFDDSQTTSDAKSEVFLELLREADTALEHLSEDALASFLSSARSAVGITDEQAIAAIFKAAKPQIRVGFLNN